MGVVTQGRKWVRQLHLALAIMIVSLHVQHYGAPFDNTVIGKRLHSVEVSSLAVLLFMLWSAVFFSVEKKTKSINNNLFGGKTKSILTWTNVLALMLIVTNVIFVAWNLWLALVAFNKKERISKKLIKGYKRMKSRISRASSFWMSNSSRSTSKTVRSSLDAAMSGSSNVAAVGISDIRDSDFDRVYGKSNVNVNTTLSNPMKVDRRSRRAKMSTRSRDLELNVMTQGLTTVCENEENEDKTDTKPRCSSIMEEDTINVIDILMKNEAEKLEKEQGENWDRSSGTFTTSMSQYDTIRDYGNGCESRSLDCMCGWC